MEAPPSLPLDLIVQILARSDPITIARGAATCKLIRRRVVTGLDIRALQRSADRFLVGIFSRRNLQDAVHRAFPLINPAKPPSEWPPIPAASFMSRTTDLFDSHRVVASSDGLLALTTRRGAVCVCNPVTGGRVSFPAPEAVSGHLYVLLPLEDDGHTGAADLSSFRLLVADKALRTQTFSSAEGGWGPVTSTPTLPVHRCSTRLEQCFPAVLGGVAHWLYRELATLEHFHVVALDVRTGRARSMAVPQDCLRRRRVLYPSKRFLLVVRSGDDVDGGAGGKLSLVVAEFTAFSIWTVPDDAAGTWVRSKLIETATILASVTPVLTPIECQCFELEWFGERSGSIVFQMHGVGLLVLNLRTKQIHQLEKRSRMVECERLFSPYEVDLVSLFTSQRKSF